VRDQQASRAAVFRFEVFAVETEGDPGLPVLKIVERDICRVVAIGMSHDVGGVCVYVREKCVERNSIPTGSEFGPPSDAVQVNGR